MKGALTTALVCLDIYNVNIGKKSLCTRLLGVLDFKVWNDPDGKSCVTVKHLYFAIIYFGDIGSKVKDRENVSPPILYAELNRGADKTILSIKLYIVAFY